MVCGADNGFHSTRVAGCKPCEMKKTAFWRGTAADSRLNTGGEPNAALAAKPVHGADEKKGGNGGVPAVPATVSGTQVIERSKAAVIAPAILSAVRDTVERDHAAYDKAQHQSCPGRRDEHR
jgi:hypothetical protein